MMLVMTLKNHCELYKPTLSMADISTIALAYIMKSKAGFLVAGLPAFSPLGSFSKMTYAPKAEKITALTA